MSSALVGLIGALLGAGISTGTAFILEERRLRNARVSDAHAAQQSRRQAARVIVEELVEATLIIQQAIASSSWWPVPEQELLSARWHEYGPRLALPDALADPSWSVVATAYTDIRELNAELKAAVSTHRLPKLDEARERSLRAVHWDIAQAIQELNTLTGLQWGPFEPDLVAACDTAGLRAAQAEYPGSSDDVAWWQPHRVYQVRTELEAVGVALVDAPYWRCFPCQLPVGTEIRAREPVTKSSMLVAAVLGSVDERNKLVPESIQALYRFEGYAVLIPAQTDPEHFELLATP
jgi:hypothetical protein